jgi:hypothetical protein
MISLFKDLRYGLRQLRRSPGFTVVAALTLVLGIGANTAIFSLFNSTPLSSVAVRDPNHLVTLQWFARTKPMSSYNSFGRPGSIPWWPYGMNRACFFQATRLSARNEG